MAKTREAFCYRACKLLPPDLLSYSQMRQIRFRLMLRLKPRSFRPLSGFYGGSEEERERRGRGEERRKREETGPGFLQVRENWRMSGNLCCQGNIRENYYF